MNNNMKQIKANKYKINSRLDHINTKDLLICDLSRAFDIYINNIIKNNPIKTLLFCDNLITKIEANNPTIGRQLDYIKPGKDRSSLRLINTLLVHNKTTQNEDGAS